jgi:ATP-dependent Clp protease protease subunit
MPLPKPRKEENKDEFIDRFMGDDVMTKEYPDESQRRAICETQWNENKEEDKAMAKGLTVVKNAKEKSADIWIYDDIGEGWFGGFSAKDFAEEIKKLGKVDILNIFLNSAGGDVFDGVAIYNILKRNRAKVIVEIDGLAASIASLIAMAGDEIRMAENAMMMIHDPWGMVVGTAKEMRKAADDMDKIKENSIIIAYVTQTGMDEKEISKLMDAETWMGAEEAKEHGFIDEITAAKKMAAYVDKNKFNFRNVPDQFLVAKSVKDQEQKEKVEKKTETKIKITSIEDWQKRIDAR